MEQNTPTVYKVRFKTAETDFLTPNLKAVPEVYNANLSSAGSVLTVPLEALNMTLQNTSATSLRFSLQPAVTGTSIVADIRRASIYDGASIDSQTNDNLTISGVFVVDDLIYSQSQEMHWTRIRQQEPLPVFGPCVRSESFLPEAVPVRLYASTGYTREPVSWHHKFSFSGLQVALWGTINIHQKCSNVKRETEGQPNGRPSAHTYP